MAVCTLAQTGPAATAQHHKKKAEFSQSTPGAAEGIPTFEVESQFCANHGRTYFHPTDAGE